MVGEVGERDPHLRAVEDVCVAITDIGGLNRAGVGAGVWLGQGEGAELFAASLGGEKALLLLLVGPLQKSQAVEPDMDAHDHPQKGVDVLQLLAGEGEGDVVEPGASILLRDGETEDAELAHFAQRLRVELAFGVPLLDVRRDLTRGEFAYRVTNLNLLGCQGEVHLADCPLLTLVENPRFGADSAMYRFPAKAASSIAGRAVGYWPLVIGFRLSVRHRPGRTWQTWQTRQTWQTFGSPVEKRIQAWMTIDSMPSSWGRGQPGSPRPRRWPPLGSRSSCWSAASFPGPRTSGAGFSTGSRPKQWRRGSRKRHPWSVQSSSSATCYSPMTR